MKKRVISFILVVCMAVSFSALPAYASDYNYTYYTQIGWKNNDGTTLNSMCFLTSIAMLVSDLGKKVNPVDVYYANGGVVSCYWAKICNYYGLTYDKMALNSYPDETAKRQAIADALASGKYPAGILVIGRTNNINHMVVARRVDNGVIYCDDPVNGSNIPISKTRRVSENIVSYWTLTPNSKWDSSGTGGTGGASQVNGISVSSTDSGVWDVTIPANYKLLLYSGNTSSSSATYVSAKSDSYEIRCSQKATLSNGAVRYYARFNTDDHYWFDCTSSMSVVDHNGPKIHTINFSANGGSVSTGYKQVAAGGVYGELPVPTRDGYTFDGWYTTANGGEQVTASTSVNLSSDQITLYAHWTENAQSHTEGHMEYRYGRYVDSAGRHDCWCSTYLENMKDVTGSAILQYSDWSTTQYGFERLGWTCGFCKGPHANVDHYFDDGRAVWKEYVLPGGSYYWEESRWVEPAN